MPSTPAANSACPTLRGILVVPGCEITRKKLSQCGNLVDERGVACMSNSDIHQLIADRYGVGAGPAADDAEKLLHRARSET